MSLKPLPFDPVRDAAKENERLAHSFRPYTAPSFSSLNDSIYANASAATPPAFQPINDRVNNTVQDATSSVQGRRSMADIEAALTDKLTAAERGRILMIHRYLRDRPVDWAGNPVLTRIQLREEVSLHRDLGTAYVRGNSEPIVSSASGVLHPRSGLVNKSHTMRDDVVDSRYTAAELCLREDEFAWLAIPGVHNPFQSERRTKNWKAQRAAQAKLEAQRASTDVDSMDEIPRSDSGDTDGDASSAGAAH